MITDNFVLTVASAKHEKELGTVSGCYGRATVAAVTLTSLKLGIVALQAVYSSLRDLISPGG